MGVKVPFSVDLEFLKLFSTRTARTQSFQLLRAECAGSRESSGVGFRIMSQLRESVNRCEQPQRKIAVT